jgi:hypothetical protein
MTKAAKLNQQSTQDAGFVKNSTDNSCVTAKKRGQDEPKTALYSIGLFIIITCFITLTRFLHNILDPK